MKKLLSIGAISLVSLSIAGSTPGSAATPPACDASRLNLDSASLGLLTLDLGTRSTRIARLSRGNADVLANDRDAKGRIVHRASRRLDDAEGKTGKPWAQKDFEKDGIPGTSTERAYAELGLQTGEPVLVAVIDSGMDINHEDLQANIWTNEAEAAGKPGTDADGDGYAGDVRGWNFLGAKDGRSVDWTNLEVTRELRRMLQAAQAAGGADQLPRDQQDYLKSLQTAYDAGVKDSQDRVKLRQAQLSELTTAIETLKQACAGVTGDHLKEVEAVTSSDATIQAAKAKALEYLASGHDYAWFKTSIDHWRLTLDFYYNLKDDPGAIVGDDPAKLDEKGYGNPNVLPVNADEAHATHVAGIIGAVRGNGKGIDGQAANVRILSLRAVPNGDERDKDIGNAIFYAVDKGARVINMSFGKAFSPQKEYVWKALDYAESKGVLVVHAAGNDALDNDVAANAHYPNRQVRDAQGNPVRVFSNVIEVGASTREASAKLPAPFSSYGQQSVDLFAPGAAILSSVPSDKYDEFDGTSMATPEVAGIAALILSQRPELKAPALREILMQSVRKFEPLQVALPSLDPKAPASLVPFTRLSVTGGVVNAYEALKLALGR